MGSVRSHPLDPRWQAVLARDPAADGAFVYAVRSTGIYCRPTCPSRRPSPGQVAFYPSPDAARAADFRPCKRCRPDDATPSDLDRVRRACRLLHAAGDSSPTLPAFATAVGTSPRRLRRAFIRLLGVTPRQYGQALRLSRFKALSNGARATVTDSLYAAGYSSPSRLYEIASGALGMTPDAYRRGAPGLTIRYTTARSPVGRVLLAATDRGICALSLGDHTAPAPLLDELRREFPRAHIESDNGTLTPWLHLVLRHLEGKAPALELPLHIRATAFQRLVWQELQRIPRGGTRSYTQIAAALGRPQSARAVGRACATNPVSLAIPCHRAVRADGDLAGYRWGLPRKRSLLRREAREAE